MLANKIRKQVGEFECEGCISNCKGQSSHLGFHGCLESFKVKCSWVDTRELYNDSLKVLGLSPAAQLHRKWRSSVIMAAKSLDHSDLCISVKSNMVVLHEVNPDIVEAISRQIQLIHAEFNGFSSSGLCNDMTNVDVAIHMDEAI